MPAGGKIYHQLEEVGGGERRWEAWGEWLPLSRYAIKNRFTFNQKRLHHHNKAVLFYEGTGYGQKLIYVETTDEIKWSRTGYNNIRKKTAIK